MKYLIILFCLAFQVDQNSSFLSPQDKKQIEQKIQAIPESVQVKFDSTFNQWVKNWKTNPETSISSSTASACKLKEYATLCEMGEEILPLLVYKLIDYKNNFIGLQLYDKLQKDPKRKVSEYTSEQEKARKTVLLWVKAL